MGRRTVHLCRPGTPDLVAITTRGNTIWMEVKGPNGKMSAAQKAFKKKIERIPHHSHHVIVALQQMIDIITIIT